MSFIRYIYNTIFKKFLDRSFTVNDFMSIIGFINDIKSGKYIDKYEAFELKGSEELAKHIDNQEKLSIKGIIDDKKRGPEIKQLLLEHRILIHALFFNKPYMLKQFSQIIDELEYNVRIEEEKGKTMRVTTQTGHDLLNR